MTATNPLLTQPIQSLFFKYYFPALISILSTTVHQVVNGLILSRQVGKEGVSAVGLFGPVLLVFIALTLPVMIGGGILISRSLGENNSARVQQVFNFSTSLGLVVGTSMAIFSPVATKWLTALVAGNENPLIAHNTSDYIFWQLLGLPFFFLRMFWGSALSNDGKPKISRNANILAVLLNIALDILLIIIFPFGVAGASVATSLAIFGSTAYLFWQIRTVAGHFSFRQFRFTLRFGEWKTLLNLGIPSFVSEITFSLGLLILNRCALHEGEQAVAAFGMVNYISFIFLRFFTAAMIASLPIMSFNTGAGMHSRVMATLRFATLFSVMLGIVATGIGWFFPDVLINIFAGDDSQDFRATASRALQIYFLLFLAAGPNYVFAAYFQSAGNSGISTAINVLKGILLLALFAFILPQRYGTDGIWLARALAEIGTLVLIVLFLTFRNSRQALAGH